MEKEQLQKHIDVLKKEVVWLENQKKKQLNKIEKRIISQTQNSKEERMVLVRYLFSIIFSLLFFGSIFYFSGSLDKDSSIFWFIVIALLGGLFIGKIIHKLREDDISEEAKRLTKEKATNPSIQKKNMSKDELERQKIIEMQIIERKKAIEATIESKKIVDARYRLDLPDLIVEK